jgi:hypothetical protein
VLASCGLYGEKGFTGNNPLSAPRFIEEVDALCVDANEALDDDAALVLRADPPADEATDDGIASFRDAIDELTEDLSEHNGPEELEQHRDSYVDVLENVDDQLHDAQDSLEDEDDKAFREHLAAAVGLLEDAEQNMRAAGFEVCGTPRPGG